MNNPNQEPRGSSGKRADAFLPQEQSGKSTATEMPQISLPTGGGALKGIEEKFQVMALTGTSSLGIPIPFSPTRGGGTPAIGLSYSSGLGNSPFGLGWGLGVPSISRKTEKQLPQYRDAEESDTFILAGAEDLVPLLEKEGDEWKRDSESRTLDGIPYTIKRYRPRTEGMFARIERWINQSTGEVHWKTISSGNIHSYYGLTPESRIASPDDPAKVFSWKLCRTHDDKGNITLFRYETENFVGIPDKQNEKHRVGKCTQSYLKGIFYGNKSPWYLGDALPDEENFMFRTLFDYGEHDEAENIPQTIHETPNEWSCRKDPFSTYRSGFEIRTYRRCKRILMFHCLPEELPHSPYLVKSLDLFYDDDLEFGSGRSEEGFSFLVRARQNGHAWDENLGHYTTKYLPDFEMSYQQHEWNMEVESVAVENAVHAPAGLQDHRYLWVDLFSEGIAGILTEQAGGWYYKRNLGKGGFENALPVAPKPSFSGFTDNSLVMQQLGADGSKYLVNYTSEPKGFFKLDDEDAWEPHRTFTSFPETRLNDSNTRLIDLNGDGLPDLLRTEENRFSWNASLGEEGFQVSKSTFKAIDEEEGPAILFADPEQSIFLADMSGDGLTDILRIRNGEVCYWPNLGYGNFGSKVGMDNAPVFDHPEAFNPQFLRLADVDGSGTIDLIYLGKDRFQVWMNQNGNEWSREAHHIPAFPAIHELSDVAVLDFLGSGTVSIVYSTPLGNTPLSFIDLMGGKKPHLLTGYHNNSGLEVSLEYKSSTHYYLEDKKEGHAWITKLPFPVYCVDSVTVEDKIRETIFINSYRYRHGYFDHEEREFRGFARVEQVDTEEFTSFKVNEASNVVEEEFHQPPVKTISWFHTGAFLRNQKIIHQCEDEYFQNELFQEYQMPEAVLDTELSISELREAHRALKGLSIRQEVYAEDGSEQSEFPYSATQTSAEIKLIQPQGPNKYASFLSVRSESISYHYERNPADPRIAQSFVLATDELGNVSESAAVVYPRVTRPTGVDAIPDKVWEEQDRLHITSGEVLFTNDVLEEDVFRLRAGYETQSYEFSGIHQPTEFFFSKQDLIAEFALATTISFSEDFGTGREKRLIGHGRSYFFKEDLSGPELLGVLNGKAMREMTYRLAYTPELVTDSFGTKVTDAMLVDAKYVHLEGDDNWWVPSGTVIFSALPADDFYVPVGARDVYGNESFVQYDTYKLLVETVTDAIGNTVQATNDYRILASSMVTDSNLNRTVAETDELGFVTQSAVMGKEGDSDGDTLADPTVRMEYDFFNWMNHGKPNYIHTFAREEHGPANPRWQESYTYTDGAGNVIMSKSQVEAGKAQRWNETLGSVEEIDADPRWIGNGRTLLNNKGNPVKKYEPYFSSTHAYEDEEALVETGVSPLIYYDPIGRPILTKMPNGTFLKSKFDSWHSKGFDANDTVMDSDWYADRGSPDPVLDPEPSDPEERAAWLAAKHHETPVTLYLNSMGRPFYSLSDYGGGKTSSVYFEKDLSGRYSFMFDELGRKVAETYTNILGESIYATSVEAGERWIFSDAMARTVKIWDNADREIWTTFDALHRPENLYMNEGDGDVLFARTIYGDLLADAADRNMKGRVYQIYDQSGVVTFDSVDFKGNILNSELKLATAYEETVNWNVLAGLSDITAIEATAAPQLETETFSFTTEVDALNRPGRSTLPDGSVFRPTYDHGNYLNQLEVQVRGLGAFEPYLVNQDYDAKGQRQFAEFGNGLTTRYSYDPETFRLVNLLTKTIGNADTQALQNLSYTFDPVGNIVYSQDDAQQTHYFQNAVVKPESLFEYDAMYRLIKATGREHAGLGGGQPQHSGLPFLAQLPHINNSTAVQVYTENYQYDDLGNILQLQHLASSGAWTRNYNYQYEGDPSNLTNRLSSTSAPGDPSGGPYSDTYEHDLRGNMTRMPHLTELHWNFMDQLKEVDLGGGGTAYYVYGIGGNRTRKVIERPSGKRIERIYLGAVEIYREYQGSSKRLERNTLHIADSTGRIAQVDTKLLDLDNSDSANPLNSDLVRYQYSNHLGSATLETDETGAVISYEEFHPFGTSSYRNSKSGSNLSLKRYRFAGKERDDESGFIYFGARYYAAWLGRWTSADPAGFSGGLNLYRYCSNNPIMFSDPNGLNDRIEYNLDELGLGDVTDPAEFSRRMRAAGFDFTGFDSRGKPMAPGPNGEGRGLAMQVNGNWEVGEWLNRPEDGEGGPIQAEPPAPVTPGPDPPPSTPSPPATPPGPPSNTQAQPSETPSPEGGRAPTDRTPAPSGTDGGGGQGPGQRTPGTPPEREPERSFWDRGGSTLLLGLGLVALGALTVATGGGALVMFSAGMAIGAGAATAVGSTALLTASYSGYTTAEEDRRYSEALSDAALVASSPGSLIGGGIGFAVDGREGMRTGAMIGGFTEAGVSLGVAGYRSMTMRAGQGLATVGEGVTLSQWRQMTTQQRKLYELGQTTVRNSVWREFVEQGIESNPLAKGQYLLDTYGSTFGILTQASNPFNLRVTWATGLTPAAAYYTPPMANGISTGFSTGFSWVSTQIYDN